MRDHSKLSRCIAGKLTKAESSSLFVCLFESGHGIVHALPNQNRNRDQTRMKWTGFKKRAEEDKSQHKV
jgi:hypothetical protein